MEDEPKKQTEEPSLYWQGKYKCPLCHSIYPVKDCEIEERQVDSKYKGATIRGRTVTHTYIDTYRYVRVCHNCAKKHKRAKLLLKIIFFAVIPIAIILVPIISGGTRDFWDLLGASVGLYLAILFFALFINGFSQKILDNSTYGIDYEKAYKDNALLTEWEIFEYKRNKE